MKLGIILSQADPETAFNILRLATFALKAGDTVEVFLTGKESRSTRFKTKGQRT